jgi:putative MATE family efflux protein
MKTTQDMTHGRPLPLMLRFAWPIFLVHAFQMLYTVSDSAIAGRLLGVEPFAAIGAAGWLHWLFLSILLGISHGFGTIFAQRFGARDLPGLHRAIGSALVMGLPFTAGLSLAGFFLAQPLLLLLDTPEPLVASASCYLKWLFGGLLISFSLNFMASLLRALGNSQAPMRAILGSSLLNIGLDVLFVAGFGMGIGGIALATLVAQLLACLYCLSVLNGIHELHAQHGAWKPSLSMSRTLLRMAAPMALQEAVAATGGIVVQSVINGYGVLFVAGMTAAKRFYGLMEVISAGMEGAVATFVAQNHGAGHAARIREGMRTAVRISLIAASFITLLMLLFGRALLTIVIPADTVDAAEILQTGQAHLFAMSLALVPLYLLFVSRAALQGAGRPLVPMLSGFVEFAIRVGAILILPTFMGRWGVYVTESIGWIGTSAVLCLAAWRWLSHLPGAVDRI